MPCRCHKKNCTDGDRGNVAALPIFFPPPNRIPRLIPTPVIPAATLMAGQSLRPNQPLYTSSRTTWLILQNDGNLVVYFKQKNNVIVPVWASNTVGSNAVILTMQTDGNLVMYNAAGRAVWATNTVNSNGALTRLVVHDNSYYIMNPVLTVITPTTTLWTQYQNQGAGFANGVGAPIFIAPPRRVQPTPFPGPIAVTTPPILRIPLTPPTPPTPADPPGTLMAGKSLRTGQSLYSPSGNLNLTMQSDGNLVAYFKEDNNPAVWASGTVGSNAVILTMQTDGNLVMYNAAGRAVWAINSAGLGPLARLTLHDNSYYGNSPVLTVGTPSQPNFWTAYQNQWGGGAYYEPELRVTQGIGDVAVTNTAPTSTATDYALVGGAAFALGVFGAILYDKHNQAQMDPWRRRNAKKGPPLNRYRDKEGEYYAHKPNHPSDQFID